MSLDPPLYGALRQWLRTQKIYSLYTDCIASLDSVLLWSVCLHPSGPQFLITLTVRHNSAFMNVLSSNRSLHFGHRRPVIEFWRQRIASSLTSSSLILRIGSIPLRNFRSVVCSHVPNRLVYCGFPNHFMRLRKRYWSTLSEGSGNTTRRSSFSRIGLYVFSRYERGHPGDMGGRDNLVVSSLFRREGGASPVMLYGISGEAFPCDNKIHLTASS